MLLHKLRIRERDKTGKQRL